MHKTASGTTAQQMQNRDAERSAVVLSAADWPVVRLSFAGAVTPESVRGLITELVALAARAEREGVQMGLLAFLDRLDPTKVTAAMRKEHVQLLKAYLPRLGTVTCAEARVVSHPVLRGMLTAMSWLLPHPWRVEVFADALVAESWLRDQCTRARERRQSLPHR